MSKPTDNKLNFTVSQQMRAPKAPVRDAKAPSKGFGQVLQEKLTVAANAVNPNAGQAAQLQEAKKQIAMNLGKSLLSMAPAAELPQEPELDLDEE